jgi:hypothetical protein
VNYRDSHTPKQKDHDTPDYEVDHWGRRQQYCNKRNDTTFDEKLEDNSYPPDAECGMGVTVEHYGQGSSTAIEDMVRQGRGWARRDEQGTKPKKHALADARWGTMSVQL